MARISDFLAQYPNKDTRLSYASSVYQFLCFVYNIQKEKKVTPEHQKKYELLAERYFSEERNPSRDLIMYAAQFDNRPAKTVRCYVSSVREFLIFHDIVITEKESRSLKNKMPKGGAATVEKDLDIETLRVILHHCSLMIRALVLLLASSGIRIGEALRLRLEDVDVSTPKEIGYITVRGEEAKGGMQRYTFCSVEAADALREWIKKRDGYLKDSLNRGKSLGISKDPNDPRLFPISDTLVSDAWENAITAAGLYSRDRFTNRLQIHPHMLRKFFSSQLRLVVPVDIVEGLMGHNGYLSDAYRRYTRKQVEEQYRKGEPYVTLSIPEGIREFQNQYDQKMQAHTEIMESLVRETMQLKKQVAELTNLTDVLREVHTDPPDQPHE